MGSHIWVFGSLNADLVVEVERQPRPGETLSGGDLAVIAGGKGANQAVAAARLGADVRMIGAVGDDAFSGILLDSLTEASVDHSRVRRSDRPTGAALITVAQSGENSIVISPGANADPTPESVVEDLRDIEPGDFLLCQLESPVETVEAALRHARARGAQTMLDPAPARPLPTSLLREVDILTPNEGEAATLRPTAPRDDPAAQAEALKAMGPGQVCLKLGAKGFYLDRTYPAFQVDAVDTTAAGDVFNAALAVALLEGRPLAFAAAAAAVSVTRKGAQPSAPSTEEVEMLLSNRQSV